MFAEMEQVYSVNAMRFAKAKAVFDPLMINGVSRAEAVLQNIVYPVIMPFIGSGTVHVAESMSGDPGTWTSVKFLGDDGTAENSEHLVRESSYSYTISNHLLQLYQLMNQKLYPFHHL